MLPMTDNRVALQPVWAYSKFFGATHRNRTDNLRITNALLCLVELGWLVADESTALPIELRRRERVYLLRL
jgi:hypothetical protein